MIRSGRTGKWGWDEGLRNHLDRRLRRRVTPDGGPGGRPAGLRRAPDADGGRAHRAARARPPDAGDRRGGASRCRERSRGDAPAPRVVRRRPPRDPRVGKPDGCVRPHGRTDARSRRLPLEAARRRRAPRARQAVTASHRTQRRTGTGTATRDREHGRPQPARARDPRPPRRGADARSDRHGPRDQLEDRRHPHPAHPREARRPYPRPGRRASPSDAASSSRTSAHTVSRCS